jgi:hypothetical protein
MKKFALSLSTLALALGILYFAGLFGPISVEDCILKNLAELPEVRHDTVMLVRRTCQRKTYLIP